MKLIIIDALRYDVASDPKVMPNLNKMHLRPIYAVANITEPSIASMLLGEYPHQHRYTALAQPDGPEILKKRARPELKGYHMFSPCDQFESIVGGFQRIAIGYANLPKPYCALVEWIADVGKKKEDFITEEVKGNQIIHIMNVHDYAHWNRWKTFYDGFSPLPDEEKYQKFSLKKTIKNFQKPWEVTVGKANDAGLLKAVYKAAANNVDAWLGKLLEQDDDIIVTADHGEGFGEKGIVFTHEDVYDFIVKVPVATNFKVSWPKLPNHTDIISVMFNEPLTDRDYTFALENTWQTRYRVTDTNGNYLIHSGHIMHYKRPLWEGDLSLKPVLLKEFNEWTQGWTKEKVPWLYYFFFIKEIKNEEKN